jgi:RNA polymerase sigma-B factor
VQAVVAQRPEAKPSKHQQQLLFVRYQRHGDLAARRALIEDFLPLARALARRYQRHNEPFDDLAQVASLGLIKAIDRFQVSHGNEFSSYAVPTILGELRRYFRDTGWALHLPRGIQERAMAVSAAIERLSADLGASPTAELIALDLGLTVEEVLEAMVAAEAHNTVSLDAPAYVGNDDSASIADSVGAEEPAFEFVEDRHAVAHAFKQLPSRERSILRLRFEDDLSQSQIADRLGISQMHVSRLIRRSLDRMRILVGEA